MAKVTPTQIVHYPRDTSEMRRILSSFLHQDEDDPHLRLTAKWMSKELKENGHVVLLLKDNDPLVFKLCKPGSHVWRRTRTKEEKEAFYSRFKKKKKPTYNYNLKKI